MRIEKIGNATLYLGDCQDILPSLGKVDDVVTDPPYGIGANKQTLGKGKKTFSRGNSDWDKGIPNLDLIHSCAETHIYWGGNYFSGQLKATNDWLIWHKKNDGRSFSECEMAWSDLGCQTRIISHHWSGEDKVHPTQKPYRVMDWCIQQLPSPASLILDPFMGSGTPGVACAKLGRSFIGIERDEEYFDIACRRIEEAYKQPDMFVSAPAPDAEQSTLTL